jgi:hypothetical protein
MERKVVSLRWMTSRKQRTSLERTEIRVIILERHLHAGHFFVVTYRYMGGPAPMGAAGVLSGDANGRSVGARPRTHSLLVLAISLAFIAIRRASEFRCDFCSRSGSPGRLSVLLRRLIGQEPYLLRAGLVCGVHRFDGAVEWDRIVGVDEDDAVGDVRA